MSSPIALWRREIAASIASAACLGGLAVLLMFYDNKPIFSYFGIVTLNTLVSVLSTASKTFLLFAIDELISQWKWIAFATDRRPLIDFERIDAASRGPVGSLGVLWRVKAVGILRIGALVVLLSIAVDPFTQQLIQNRQDVVYTSDGNTTIARAVRYSKGSEYSMQLSRISSTYNPNVTNTFADADFSMQSSILYGLDQSLPNVIKQGTFTCASGNCTWPAFESLAICSRCSDLTDTLERLVTDARLYTVLETDNGAASITKDGGTAFRLANGLYIDNSNGWVYGLINEGGSDDIFGAVMMTSFGTSNASETVTMSDLDDTLIWAESMIRITPDAANASAVWPNLPVSATECALHYCINRYTPTVVNGTLQVETETVSDATRETASWQPEGSNTDVLNDTMRASIAFSSYYSVIQRTDLALTSPATGEQFNLSQNAVDSISAHFQTNFATPDSRTEAMNITDDGEHPGRLNGYYMNSSNVQYTPGVMQALFAADDLNATFASLAASMSNAMRAGADTASSIVHGEKGTETTFYEIAWPWIALPGTLVVAGLVFLALTIHANSRLPEDSAAAHAWKSSSLAVMSRGTAVGEVLGGDLQSVKQMERRSQSMRVTLFGKTDLSGFPLDEMPFDHSEIDQLSATGGARKGGQVRDHTRELSESGDDSSIPLSR